MAPSPIPRQPSGRALHPEQRRMNFFNDDTSDTISEQLDMSFSSGETTRKVKFSNKVRSRRSIKYTTKEKEASFYHDDELEDINDEVHDVVVLHSTAPEKLHPTKDTIRGLEDQIKIHQGFEDSTSEVAQDKSKAAVLRIQYQQKQQKLMDADRIASAYSKTTKDYVQEARQRGKADEHMARICWTSTMMSSPSVSNSSNRKRATAAGDAKIAETKLGVVSVCESRANMLREKRRERVRQTIASMAA